MLVKIKPKEDDGRSTYINTDNIVSIFYDRFKNMFATYMVDETFFLLTEEETARLFIAFGATSEQARGALLGMKGIENDE